MRQKCGREGDAKMPTIPLSLKFVKKNDYTVCTITGDLAGEAIIQFKNGIIEKQTKDGIIKLALDLNGIHNFNSTALDTILALQNILSTRQCSLALVVSKSEIRELLDITCCSTFFPIFHSLADLFAGK